MQFYDKITINDLERTGRPTFNVCEHYLIKPHPNTMQTIVIELENEKFLTVNINPQSDNVDVQLHGEHRFQDFGNVKAFYNMADKY